MNVRDYDEVHNILIALDCGIIKKTVVGGDVIHTYFSPNGIKVEFTKRKGTWLKPKIIQ